jgi:hypothetical protein
VPGFVSYSLALVSYILAFLLVCLVFVAIYVWSRGRAATTTAITHRLLFAVVILLFAIVFKLVSRGQDALVLIIALVGLGVGWYGMSAEPR